MYFSIYFFLVQNLSLFNEDLLKKSRNHLYSMTVSHNESINRNIRFSLVAFLGEYPLVGMSSSTLFEYNPVHRQHFSIDQFDKYQRRDIRSWHLSNKNSFQQIFIFIEKHAQRKSRLSWNWTYVDRSNRVQLCRWECSFKIQWIQEDKRTSVDRTISIW